MDAVAAARRLQELNIKQLIIQASFKKFGEGEIPQIEDIATDGPIIREAALAAYLVNEGVTHNKVFIGLPNSWHMTSDAFEAALPEMRVL